jgi:hypothetical protein
MGNWADFGRMVMDIGACSTMWVLLGWTVIKLIPTIIREQRAHERWLIECLLTDKMLHEREREDPPET